jgi:hypothetical protein
MGIDQVMNSLPQLANIVEQYSRTRIKSIPGRPIKRGWPPGPGQFRQLV